MIFRVQNEPLQVRGDQILQTSISLELNQGDLCFLLGPNGSGKSTFLRQVYDGSLKSSCAWFLKKLKLAYLPQLLEKDFFIPATLKDVLVLLGLEASSTRLTKGLDLSRLWNSASGGEKQRILLTCVLSECADFFLLDEPTNHLDLETQSELLAWIQELREQNKTFLWVHHDHSCLENLQDDRGVKTLIFEGQV